MGQGGSKFISNFLFIAIVLVLIIWGVDIIHSLPHIFEGNIFKNIFVLILYAHVFWAACIILWMYVSNIDNLRGQLPYFVKQFSKPHRAIIRKIFHTDHRTYWTNEFPHLAAKIGVTILSVVGIIAAIWLTVSAYNMFFGTAIIYAAETPDANSTGVLGNIMTVIMFLLIFALIITVITVVIKFITPSKKSDRESEIINYKKINKEQIKSGADSEMFIPSTKSKKFKNTKDTLILSQHLKLISKKVFEHLLVVGPTGSGKSRSIVIPQLLNTDGVSLVVTDPKSELYAKTKAQFEEKGYQVDHLNLNNSNESIKFNLLQNCKTPDEVRNLCDSILKNGGDNEFEQLSLNLFEVYTFIVWERGGTLSDIIDLRAETPDDVEEMELTLIDKTDSKEAKLAFENFKKTSNADKFVASVNATIDAAMKVFDRDAVRNVQNGLFDITKYRQEKRVLFVSYPSDEADFYAPFLSSSYYQIMNKLKNDTSVNEDTTGQEGLGVFFILDEFANIGKLPSFEKFLTTARSKKIGIEIFLQSKEQLASVYGENTTDIILDNCKTKIALPGTSGKTAELFTESAGEETIKTFSYSADGKRSSSEKEKETITKDEIRRLKGYQTLIVSNNLKPVLDDLNYYYMDNVQFFIYKHSKFDADTTNKIIHSDIVKSLSEALNKS